MKLNEQGQITIPVNIRRELNLDLDSDLDIRIVGETIQIKKAQANCTPEQAQERINRVRGVAKGRFTTDEIMRMTRGED